MRTYEGRVNERHLFLRWEAHSIKPSSWWKGECMGMGMECCHSWDAEGGVAIGGPLTGRLGNILFVSFSPDSQFLVSTTSYGIIVWDVGSRKMKYELLDGYFFCSIGFSSSSKTFVAGDQLETCERQVTRYVISEGVANCRHIPMGPHRFVLCKLSVSYLFWTEELATIGSSEAICVPIKLHSHVSSCIS